MSGAPLAFDDAFEILGPALPGDDVVLVGGQAVNYWLSYYRDREPSLAEVGLVTSDDVDFYGMRDAALRMKQALAGSNLELPSFGDATPNSALLTFKDEAGVARRIDFLWSVHGIPDKRVRETAVDVELLSRAGEPTGIHLRILHPVLCLVSRIRNTCTWATYQTPRALQQARAAIGCARGFLSECCEKGDPRVAHRSIRFVGELAASPAGKMAFAQFDLDVLAAIPRDARLGAPFLATQLPRLYASAGRAYTP